MNFKRWISVGTSMGVFVFMLALPALAQHGAGGGGHAAGGAGGIGHGAGAAGEHGSAETTRGKSSGASEKELQKVVSNPNGKLAQKLTSLLPSGMTLEQASSGFKNLGQFVAALHVYHNLGLASKNPPVTWSEFATAVQSKSLGSAIKQFDPTVNAKTEAKKGTRQAKDDIGENS
jgi:hypothetical protein